MTGLPHAVHEAGTGGYSPGELARLGAAAGAAEALSRHLLVIAGGLEGAAGGLPTPMAVRGPASFAISQLLAVQPSRMRQVGSACRQAAGAYARYADLLQPAISELQRALSAPPDLADVLTREARLRSQEAARLTASTLAGLAAVAPRRPSRWRRWLARADDLRAEVLLGVEEAAESTAGAVIPITTLGIRPPAPAEAAQTLADLKELVTHPVATGRAVLDYDTWRSNPARAIGHLLPSLAGGGSAASRVAAGQAGRLEGAARAAQLARAEESGRRAATAAAARSARSQLIGRSTTGHPVSDLPAWRGEAGLGLTPQATAAVERFSALAALGEPTLTETMREVSRAARAELAGLAHRLKDGESMKRKVATQQANTGRALPVLLNHAEDAVRYTVVLNERSYVSGVEQITALLDSRGYHHLSLNNAWHSQRYRGINTTWADPSTGIAFEVQFHTPATWRITRETHGAYEEFRRPDTSPARRAELSEQIGAAYRTAPVPAGVKELNRQALPPSSVLERVPVDYTVHAGVGGTLGPGVAREQERGGCPAVK